MKIECFLFVWNVGLNDSASPDYLLIIFEGLSGFLGSFIDSVLGGLQQYSGDNLKY